VYFLPLSGDIFIGNESPFLEQYLARARPAVSGRRDGRDRDRSYYVAARAVPGPPDYFGVGIEVKAREVAAGNLQSPACGPQEDIRGRPKVDRQLVEFAR